MSWNSGEVINTTSRLRRLSGSIPSDYTIWYNTTDSKFYAEPSMAGGSPFSGTDAATLIQSAYDACPSGGKVHIKAALYPLSTRVTQPNIIVELDPDAILRDISGTGLDSIYNINESNAILRGGVIDGNTKSNTVFSIVVSGGDSASNILVENVHIKNVKNGHTGWLAVVWDTAETYKISNVTFRHCQFTDDPETTMDNIAISFSKDILFDDCLFDVKKTVAVYYSKYVTFHNCVFQNFTTYATIAAGGYDIKILGCTFKDNDVGVRIGSCATDAEWTDPSGNVRISNCFFNDCPLIIRSNDATVELQDIIVSNCEFTGDSGIILNGSDAEAYTRKVTITNNIFRDILSAPIQAVYNLEEIIVKGNHVVNGNMIGGAYWTFGFLDAKNVIIANNTIVDEQLVPTTRGIYLEDCTFNIVSGNTIENTTGESIVEVGTTDYSEVIGNATLNCGSPITIIGVNSEAVHNIEV